jgi:hypothetical protein
MVLEAAVNLNPRDKRFKNHFDELQNSIEQFSSGHVVHEQKNQWPNQAPAGSQPETEAPAWMLNALKALENVKSSTYDEQVRAVQALALHVEKELSGPETPVIAKLLEVGADRRRHPEVREAAAWALAPHLKEDPSWINTPEKVELLEEMMGEIKFRRSQWR